MSGLLIIFSLLKFKELVKTMQLSNAGFFAGERVMAVHMGIFSMFIIATFADFINSTIFVVKQ